MILTVGLNNAFQKVLFFSSFSESKVNRASLLFTAASGKGLNVARAVKYIGIPCTALGFTGGETGKTIIEALRDEDVPERLTKTTANTRTCITLLNSAKNTTTELVEPSEPVTRAELEMFTGTFKAILQRVSLVTISGTVPPGINPAIYAELIRIAGRRGVKTIADICGAPMKRALHEKPYMLKMNLDEFTASFGRKSTEKTVKGLMKDGVSIIIITDGKNPFLAGIHGLLYRVTPPRVTPLNTVGSGDAMTAGFAAGIHGGFNAVKLLSFASACGAASAETFRPSEFKLSRATTLMKRVKVKRL